MPDGGPIVSIVIPAHNAHPQIESALASCEAQTVKAFEVVIVDDGSDRPLAPELRSRDFDMLVHRQGNRGPAVARNVGAELANGRYVAFLDADDVLMPRWVQFIAEGSSSGATMIHGGCEVVDLVTGEHKAFFPRALGPAFGDLLGLFLPGAYALRRDSFFQVGGFIAGLPYGEHSELALRLASQLTDAPVRSWTRDELIMTKFHDRGPERYASYDISRKQGAEYVLRCHHALLKRDPALIADYHAVAGVASFRLGMVKEGRSHLMAAARLSGLKRRHVARAMVSLIPVLGSLYWKRHGRRDAL